MDCLVQPVSTLRMRCFQSSRLSYRRLLEESSDPPETRPVKVLVGKEKKEFFVEPFVLEEKPFQLLIGNKSGHGVVHVDVDAILFEHLLWLMRYDSSSLFQLNIKEIIEFYAQD